MVLVEILIFQGHVPVVNGYGQLSFTKQPLFCQIIIYLVSCLHQMIRFSIIVKIISLGDDSFIQHVGNALAWIPHALSSQHKTKESSSITSKSSTQKPVNASTHAIRIHCKQNHRINAGTSVRPCQATHPSRYTK